MWSLLLWVLSHLHLLIPGLWPGQFLPFHAFMTDTMLRGVQSPFDPITPLPTATPMAGDPDAQKISTFFSNLYDNGIKPVVYAIALFFFAWGAIGLMFPGERNQDHAKAALYRALGGLALALLATAVSSIIRNAIPQ